MAQADYPSELQHGSAVEIGMPVRVGEVRDEAVRQLLLGFESLGENCEFGLVQRRYAAEPLSLFRWATTSPDTLLDILTRRFEGFGSPAQTEIREAPWGELMAYDLRFDTKMHTFVHRSGVDLAAFAALHGRRIAFLTRKLRDDLVTGDKIMVFQCGDSMTDALAMRLHAAIRAHGPAPVLAVGLADAAHPCGSVIDHGCGLLRASIGRPGRTITPHGHCWNIDFEAWVAICRRARALACTIPSRSAESRAGA